MKNIPIAGALLLLCVPASGQAPAVAAGPAALAAQEERGDDAFEVHASRPAHQPGEDIVLRAGTTLRDGQSFLWRLKTRNAPNYVVLRMNDRTGTVTLHATQALDGAQVWVDLMPAGVTAPLNSLHCATYVISIDGIGSSTGEAITLGRLRDLYYVGDPVQLTVRHRNLRAGERVQWVQRAIGVAGQHSWTAATVFTGTNPYSLPASALATREYALQLIDTAGTVIGQSAAIQPHVRSRQLTISGVAGVYRQGTTVRAHAVLSPRRERVRYQWGVNRTANSNGGTPISDTMSSSLEVAVDPSWHNRALYVQAFDAETGTLIARGEAKVRVTTAAPGERVLLTDTLGSHGDHYHSTDTIALRAYTDPVPGKADRFQWFWWLPGEQDWSPIPGGSSAIHERLKGEQALHDARIRIEHYNGNGELLARTEAGTIKINDHGLPAPQRVRISGMQPQYAAGETVKLAAVVSPATLLQSRRWFVQLAADTAPRLIEGAAGSDYAFTATEAWDGALITAAVISPDGRVIYGPSRPVKLNLSKPAAAAGVSPE